MSTDHGRLDALLAQRRVLADFATLVVDSDDLQRILDEACAIVSRHLDTPIAKVLQRMDGEELLVRAGHGIRPDFLGRRVAYGPDTAEGFSLAALAPVTSDDVTSDGRFHHTDLLAAHDVKAFLNVPIPSGDGALFGLLEVDCTEPRRFGEDDIVFLRTYGTLIGAFVRRAATVDLLRETVAERDHLLTELQHRTKNDLAVVISLLTLQGRRSRHPEVRRELEEVSRRVEALRLVHEKLHHSRVRGRLDLAGYLSDVAHGVVRFHQSRAPRVRMALELDPLMVDARQAVPTGLIVNEFVTNSFKYAFPKGRGTLRIVLDDLGDEILLTLSDSGPGLPEGAAASSGGAGMQIIGALARQLGGALEWGAADGTVLKLRFSKVLP